MTAVRVRGCLSVTWLIRKFLANGFDVSLLQECIKSCCDGNSAWLHFLWHQFSFLVTGNDISVGGGFCLFFPPSDLQEEVMCSVPL